MMNKTVATVIAAVGIVMAIVSAVAVIIKKAR